ncbi:MAG TPA: alkaline phosphatase PhoX, partial [Lamprocystis sp. (in: g-proteobacteria)]|nr:alkaline phosphatase PhoX [Lamprocystis sp. (in: g-proteobacteria)]
MHLKAQLPAAIAAALFAAAPVLAGQLQPEKVSVPGETTYQTGVGMSGNEDDKQLILSSEAAKVNGSLTMTGYNVLLRSGAELPLLEANGSISSSSTRKFGAIYDILDQPVLDGTTARISNDNDFNSLIQGADDRLYLISHFETRPGAIYQTLLNQEPDGALTPQATRYVDFKGYQGGWVHCAGSVSPWGTHLGSEEYEPDARMWSSQTGGTDSCPTGDLPKDQRPSEYESAMVQYLVDDSSVQYNPSCANALAHMNPYRYGFPVEVAVGADGLATVKKHFAMGRQASELSFAMPDQKTVYITDDGTNTMLLMFIADAAENLDAGTLYAAKWTQLNGNEAQGGRGAISWVNLGHTDSATISAAINGQTFDNLFEVGPLNS